MARSPPGAQVRAEGTNGLGQVLKSFRDRNVAFLQDGGPSAYLDSLGPSPRS
ncbi:hypothetical protein GOD53_32350 [Sinorhizobium medicae]|nr:hypothetical protein [Sinorhizobium medicae]MDX0748272.1 hypothetical protein [Sinorhizobium medicae]